VLGFDFLKFGTWESTLASKLLTGMFYNECLCLLTSIHLLTRFLKSGLGVLLGDMYCEEFLGVAWIIERRFSQTARRPSLPIRMLPRGKRGVDGGSRVLSGEWGWRVYSLKVPIGMSGPRVKSSTEYGSNSLNPLSETSHSWLVSIRLGLKLGLKLGFSSIPEGCPMGSVPMSSDENPSSDGS
jgi:hypothetical protein